MSEADRLCQFRGQAHGVVRHRDGLIGAAEQPQGQSHVVPAAHARIVAAVAERMRAMLVGVVESKTLLGVFATEEELAAKQKDRPGGVMGLEEKLLVLLSLGQLEELVGKIAGGLKPHPQVIEIPEPPDRGVGLPGVADPLGKLPRPQIRRRYLRSWPFRGYERDAQGVLKPNLLARVLRRIGQALEQLEAPREMSDRLLVGKALGRLLPGSMPVADGLFGQFGIGQMAGEHFRTVGGDLRELLLQRFARCARAAAGVGS